MRLIFSLLIGLLLLNCGPEAIPPQPETKVSRGILLITLDTTRADHCGYISGKPFTPHLDRLAEKGQAFTQAYATVPTTLPSHTSMMTGLYPAGHGIHENGRYLRRDLPLLAPQLAEAGYATAAFVSAYPLAGSFGLRRGFSVYDDVKQGERGAEQTTDAALHWLASSQGDGFLWVHYFDAHHPYASPLADRFPQSAYGAEMAFADLHMQRLIDAFRAKFSADHLIAVVGDHGEGLGEHGEQLHGRLLFQGTVHVPLVVAGTGIAPQRIETPVSIRRIYQTLAARAGLQLGPGLGSIAEPVLAEAMKPYLQYGWSPQVMVIDSGNKFIKAKDLTAISLVEDPIEDNPRDDLRPGRDALKALRDYPLPNLTQQNESLSKEQQAQLASLGYVASTAVSNKKGERPNPVDLTHLFPLLDRGSLLFVNEQYEEARAVFEKVLADDPDNLMILIHQAVSYSLTGNPSKADQLFQRARSLTDDSVDLDHYQAMHFFQHRQWDKAGPLFERVIQRLPDKVPALVSLARIRERERRPDEALSLMSRVIELEPDTASHNLFAARLHMALRRSDDAISGFERARSLQGSAFDHYLDLGVCYMDVRRFDEAANCFEQVADASPEAAIARFKRAQVAALRQEPDTAERIAAARRLATPQTRQLIDHERLFDPWR